MSKWNNNNIVAVRFNNIVIQQIYKGSRLVWELVGSIKSCFGGGNWIDNLPWLNDDAWKN